MKFSVTIPTYKRHYLREAIESVTSQTYADWELIVVDDCSPDDIVGVVKPFLNDTRIHYYRNEKNCGAVDVVDNWNICLGYCTGDYVICIGDDDRLLPCCLEEYKKLIEAHPHLNVYHGRTEIINGVGEIVGLQEPRPHWESALSLLWNRWAFRNKQFIGDFCYRTDYLKAAGGYYRLPLAWGSDDITAVLAAKENGIANTEAFVFEYRDNDRSISNSPEYARKKIEATMTHYEWFGRFLQEMSDGLQRPETSSNARICSDDDKYLKTIAEPRAEYYRNSLAKDCIDYICGRPVRLLWCYRRLKTMGYSKATYIKWYLKSFRV